MNSTKETIQGITEELKTLLIHAKRELKTKNETLKKKQKCARNDQKRVSKTI